MYQNGSEVIFMDKSFNGKRHAREKKEKRFFVAVFTGTMLSLLAGLSLLLLLCFLALYLEDPTPYTPIFSLASLFITAIMGGYFSSRGHRKHGLACGTLSGILLVSFLILLAFAFGKAIRLSIFAICAPSIVICAAIAGIVGVDSGKSKRPKKHKLKF